MRTHRSLLGILSCSWLVFAACGSETHDLELEGEPFDDGTNTIYQGLISCQERTAIGYRHGTPFDITVVTVDGKPAEVHTANAYWVMQQAAADDGVELRIISGFRTMAEQQYLYACHVNCNCNNCNLAAYPGTSNHQSGHALDLNTSSSGVYSWLAAHGARFGFRRTVDDEPWHWEWWGGGPGGGPCGPNNSRPPLAIRTEAALSAHLHDARATTDIDGDGIGDLCARNKDGVRCVISNGRGFGRVVLGPELSDDRGWNKRNRYSTLRFADIDGDGDADLCGRGSEGFACWRSNGTGFGPRISNDFMSDENGWDDAKYFSTIRMADINGDSKTDVCARHESGFRCWLSEGNGFRTPFIEGPEWSDEKGWDQAKYYSTIRMGDVDGDGKDDVCARNGQTMVCFLSTGTGFGRRVDGPDWGNEESWDEVNNYSTIRLVDVDGDGKADLCGRGNQVYKCHRSRGTSFGPAIAGPELSNESSWDEHDQYSTIRFADIDGDGDRDLCGRGRNGFRCWRWRGSDFGEHPITGGMLSDRAEWDLPRYYRTIRMSDIDGDGDADLCARSVGGMKCWRSNGADFTAAISGPEWSDDRKWNEEAYGATIRIAE